MDHKLTPRRILLVPRGELRQHLRRGETRRTPKMRTACLAAFSAATLFACSGAGNRSSTGSRQQAEEQELFYFYTCGDPVCHVEGGADNGSGLRACTTEQAGDPCDAAGDQCDPGA